MMRWMKEIVGCLVMGVCVVGVAIAQTVTIEVPSNPVSLDSGVEIIVKLQNATQVHGYSVMIAYDPQLLRYIGAQKSTFLPPGNTMFFVSFDSLAGRITIDEAVLGTGTQSGTGPLHKVQFVAQRVGSAPLGIVNADIRDGQNQRIPVTTTDAVVQVNGVTGVIDERSRPQHFELDQNFPNPFNPSTSIVFRVPGAGMSEVQIDVLNALGKNVASLLHGPLSAGEQRVVWDGMDQRGQAVSSGVYFCRMQCGGLQKMIRMVLVR